MTLYGLSRWRPALSKDIELSLPSKSPSFGARGVVFAPVFVFVKPNKNKFISMKPNSNLDHFQQILFHTIPPPLDQYNLYLVLHQTGATKPLLVRQNWHDWPYSHTLFLCTQTTNPNRFRGTNCIYQYCLLGYLFNRNMQYARQKCKILTCSPIMLIHIWSMYLVDRVVKRSQNALIRQTGKDCCTIN